MPYSSYTKRPGEAQDVALDWLTHLGEDTISSSTWPVTPPGITVVSTSSNASSATIKLSAGTNGQSYRFVNRIVTAGGRTEEWVLVVHVFERVAVPVGPPYASLVECQAVQPAAEGAEALKVSMVLEQAASWVARLAPKPAPIKSVLSEAMTDTQDTVPVPRIEIFRASGQVALAAEVLQYEGKIPTALYATTGPGVLANVIRGRHATVPSSHAPGSAVEDVSYPIAARNAELSLFEWLWETRGYKPSRTGVVGSESYSIDKADIKEIVKATMGEYYTGGARLGSVGVVSSFARHREPRRGG